MKKIGKLLSAAVCCLGFAICILVALMFILDRDGDISNLVWTKSAVESYNKSPETFSVEYIKAYDDAYFTEDGYFSVSASRRIPSIDQWQMTLRYNRSTVDELSRHGKIKEPEKEDLFTFTLTDNTGKVYSDFSYLKQIKGRYTYYRLVFDNVNIKKVDEIKINIYLTANDSEPELVGELPLFYSELPRDTYNFKKEMPENMNPTAGLMSSEQLSGKER